MIVERTNGAESHRFLLVLCAVELDNEVVAGWDFLFCKQLQPALRNNVLLDPLFKLPLLRDTEQSVILPRSAVKRVWNAHFLAHFERELQQMFAADPTGL